MTMKILIHLKLLRLIASQTVWQHLTGSWSARNSLA